MTPETALLRVIHCLDQVHESGFKTKAFVRALDVVRTTDPVEIAERARDERLTELDGIGDTTATVITEALAGLVPSYLTKIEDASVVPMTEQGRSLPRSAAGRLPPPLRVERRRAPRSRRWPRRRSSSVTSTWCSPTTRRA